MKRFFALVMALCFSICAVAAAEGKLKATEKTLIVFDGEYTGYFFGKIENIGDASISVGSCNLVAFTEDDEILFSESWVTSIPSSVVLDPGEYVYVYEYIFDNALKETSVADFKFSPSSSTFGNAVATLPTNASFDLKGADTYKNYVYVTFTNTTDKTIDQPYVVAALYDEQGELVYVGYNSMSNVAVHANSTITVTLSIDNDLMEYYNKNGINITNVDALVYFEE